MLPGFSALSAFREIGLGLYRLALDREDDVGAIPLRVVHQGLPGGSAGGDVGDHQAAHALGKLELLRNVSE